MQKKPFQLLFVLLLAFSFVVLSGCKKTEDIQLACTLTLVKGDGVVISSTLNPAKQGVGVQLTVIRNDSVVDKINRTHNGNNDFTISGLKPNTNYKVEIKIINNNSLIAEPCTTSFTTLLSSNPLVNTNAIANVTPSGAEVGGDVTFQGLFPITERGVYWGLTTTPTVNGNRVIVGSGLGSFTHTLTGLTSNTKYYVCAYAKTSAAVVFGATLSFTTPPIIPTAPTVTTTTASGITQTGATTGGNVTSAGTASVTARGVCWGATANPDISGNKTTNGTGTGTFTSTLTGLVPATTYHIRAYATNSVGTSYGADEVFTTAPIVAPTVTTTAPSSVTQTTANAGGNVTSSGGALVTALGVCYGTSPNPDLSGTFTNNGSGTGGYTSPLSGLTPGTTYHVRAYATNSVGTSYGANFTFTTLP